MRSVDDDAIADERFGAPVLRDEREQAMFDLIPLAGSRREMILSGAYVGTVVPPPAISLLNAPQYLTGKVLGDKAAEYIKLLLGGKAKVVLLTHDSLQFLVPRFTAMRDSLRDMPGVVIVADISPLTVDEAGGHRDHAHHPARGPRCRCGAGG